MAKEIRIPRLGWSMDEGKFMGWLKKPGEFVQLGEPLFELEGEKATQEIESVDEGLLYVAPNGPSTGDMIAVGAILGYLLAENETPPQHSTQPVTPDSRSADIPSTSAPQAKTTNRNDPNQLQKNSLASNAQGQHKRQPVTPRARRAAKNHSINLREVTGTGRNGRIRESDVLHALQHANNVSAVSVDPNRLVTLQHRRLAIANQMRLSREKTVPVTLTTKADVTELAKIRRELKQKGIAAASWSAIAAWVAAGTIVNHPAMGSRWLSDHQLLLPDLSQIDIGIAVDTPDGLLVPVLRSPNTMSLDGITKESESLIERARSGKLKQSQLEGGCFTITSLASFGIDTFSPIIHYPQIAILGLGAIRSEPTWNAMAGWVPREWLSLSLTFDHRAIDGAPAARFLQEVAQRLQNNPLQNKI